jgi:hypothetical protein
MAGKSTAISIHITGDASGARKAFKDASAAASGFEGKAAAASAKFTAAGEKMQQTGKDLSLKVSLPLVAAGGAAFKMAADVQDAMGASSQIYGSASGDVKRWANSLPSYYGIAKGEAYEYTNIMGSLMKNLGGLTEEEAAKQSTALTGLAGDLAAMYGGTTEQAVNAMTSALKGNTEMLDNYGISATAASLKAKALELGISDGTSVLTDQQKQAAMLAIIWEQTGDAQGQAARESEGASGQMRAFTTDVKNLASDLGTKLLPAGTEVLGWGRSALDVFGNLPGPVQNGALAVGALAAAAGPATYVLGSMSKAVALGMDGAGAAVGAWNGLRGTLDAVSQVAATQGVSKFTALSNIMGQSWRESTKLRVGLKGVAGAAIGLAAVQVSFDWLNEGAGLAQKAEDAHNRLTIAIRKGNQEDAFAAFSDAVAAEQSTLRIQNLWQEFGSEIELVGTGVKADVEQVQRAFDQLDPQQAAAALDALESATAGLDKSSRQYAINTEFIQRNRESLGLAAEAADAKAEADGGAASASSALGTVSDETAGSLEDLNAALSEASQQLERMSGVALEADQAERALKDATDQLMQSLAENGRTFDINTEKGRANRDALDAQVQAAFELATAQSQIDTTGKSSTETLNGQVGALMRMQQQGLITKDEYNRLLQVYGLTPDAITTRINADTTAAKNDAANLTTTLRNLPGVPAPVRSQIEAWIAAGSFHAARAEIDRLTARRTISIDAYMRIQNIGDPAKLFGWGARAKGGPVSAGMPYMVGEEGPELIVPDANGMVLTAAETAALGRGAGSGGRGAVGGAGNVVVHNHINLSGALIDRFAERRISDLIESATRKGLLQLSRLS